MAHKPIAYVYFDGEYTRTTWGKAYLDLNDSQRLAALLELSEQIQDEIDFLKTQQGDANE